MRATKQVILQVPRKSLRITNSEPIAQQRPQILLSYASIFAIAFSLRLGHILQIKDIYPFFNSLAGDSASYNDWARNIASGHWIGNKVFYQDPLYPYFLALIYRFIRYSPFLIRLIQAALGAANCVLIYEIARRLFDRKVAVLAGLISAGYGLFIFYEGSLLKEGISVFLGSWTLLGLILANEKHSPARWFYPGALFGLLILTRGNALLLIPFIISWIVWTYHKDMKIAVRSGALFLCGILIPLLPATAHNYLVARDFVLTTNQAGSNFYIGNHPNADGIYAPLIEGRQMPSFEGDDARQIAEFDLGKPLKPSAVSRYWFKKAGRFIQKHPLEWILLLGKKAKLFIDGYEIPDVEDYYLVKKFSSVLRLPAVSYGFVCPLSILGMVLAANRFNVLCPLYVFVIGNAVSIIFFFVFARYRLPSLPPMIIFAAYALSTLWQWFRNRLYSRLCLATLALSGLLWFVNHGKSGKISYFMATSLTNLAVEYQAEGQTSKALATLKEVTQYDPEDIDAHFNLANIYLQMGDTDRAIVEYGATIRLAPHHVEAKWLLGRIYYGRHDFIKARLLWEEVLRLEPSYQQARAAIEQLNAKGQ